MKFFCIVTSVALLWIAPFSPANAQSREIARLHTQMRSLHDHKGRAADGQADLRSADMRAADTVYVDTLTRLAKAFYGVNADSAFFYGRAAVDYASGIGYPRGESEAYRMLGNTYEMVGDYANMLSNYHHSLDIAERIGNIDLIAKANYNIALFYKQEGEYDQAEQLMQKVSEGYKMNKDSTESAYVFSHLSDLAFQRRDYALALRYASQALDIATRMKDEPLVATGNNAIGKAMAAQGNYSGALTYYVKALAWYREAHEKLGWTATTSLMAAAYLSLKDYPQALLYAQQSLSEAVALHHKPESQGAARVLADIYEAKGDDKKALFYYKLYKQYSDSLSNDQSHKQVLSMTAQYDFDKRASLLKEMAAKKDAEYERTLRKDSLEVAITVTVSIVLILLAFVLLRERALHKRVNQLLREKNEKIEEQKEALEHQAVQLLLNNQQKDKLFSIVAHDLRGPLNSLKGLLDFLKEKKLSEAEINLMMTELRRNVDSSSELVGNLLFWASSQLDGIVVKPVVLPLKGLVHDTLALFAHQAKEKKVELREELSDSIEGYADKDMIQMVIRNLVSNAIKFCRPGDSVTVCCNEAGEAIEISVVDTGIGMKEEALERIRRKESFTSYGTAKEKGTGLGMLLCQEFTTANKGRFRVESEWGKGSSCYLTIPVAPSSSSISV